MRFTIVGVGALGTIVAVHLMKRPFWNSLRSGSILRETCPDPRMSALQDLENKKRLEVRETLGHVIEMATKFDIELKITPFFAWLFRGWKK